MRGRMVVDKQKYLLKDCGKVCESASIGLWEYHKEDDIMIGSKIFWEMLDETPCEWTFQTYIDRIHAKDQKLVKAYWKQMRADSSQRGIIFRFKLKSGRLKWFKALLMPHKKTPQSVIHGCMFDVTKEQEALHIFNRRFERLKRFVNNMPGVAYVARNDQSYTMLYVSDNIEWLTGYPSDAFFNQDIAYYDLIHPDDQAKVRQVVNDIVEKEKALGIEYRIITKDGDTKWVFEQGTPDYDDFGNVQYVSGVIIDVSRRKQLDEALAMERQKMRRLVDSTADIIFEVDINRVFVSVFGNGLKKIGLKPQDFEGKTVVDVFGKHGSKRYEIYDRALSGENINYNWMYETKTNTLHFHSSISPIRNAQGEVTGAVGIAREITNERKQALEYEYLSHHDSLTDLYNRHYLYEVIERELHRANRYKEHLSLVVIDIDDFKEVNSNYGHMAGDAILQTIASCFKDSVRKSDLVFRTGGEEFLILLPKTSGEAALKLAERIRHTITVLDNAYDIQLTCSFGVAENHHQESFETWWRRADDAMRLAKKQGKDRVEFAKT